MCNICWQEFKGWCKSFTRIEICLSLVQALLLAALIGLLSFLTLHLLVCEESAAPGDTIHSSHIIKTSIPSKKNSKLPSVLHSTKPFGETTTTASRQTAIDQYKQSDIECTWSPSKKTTAATHYYWTDISGLAKTTHYAKLQSSETDSADSKDDLDGDDAPLKYKDYVAALVKLDLPAKVTFACILTKVTQYWTLTAASCIEALEEIDSLDLFFIMESFGESIQGRNHTIADVQIHPLYQGVNYSYDLAALRSVDSLAANTVHLLQLATMLDYFVVGIGERFTILGYGEYRSMYVSASVRGLHLRRVWAYTTARSQCGSVGGVGALCAGTLYARGDKCAYCAGTPLIRASLLYGVMSHNKHCALTCEPTLYVNVAEHTHWIHSLIMS